MNNPQYVCPMHPEIVSNHPGTCSKCGMDLVLMEKAVVHSVEKRVEDKGLGKLTWKSYLPLIVVISIILLVTVAISIQDAKSGIFDLSSTISYFMIGFFLTFASFKLIDLSGFAHGYQTYDLLAKRAPWYGYVYPFIELFFGIAMILAPLSKGLLFAEFIVMAFSGLGVAIKIGRKEEFMCSCLGTFLKVPLTKITLIEDFGMATLALIMMVI